MFKYVAHDVETTSLVTESKNLLQVSLIVDDLSVQAPVSTLPHLTFYVHQNDGYSGQPFALAMNQQVLYTLAAAEKSGKIFPGSYYDKLFSEDFVDGIRGNEWIKDRELSILLTLDPKDFEGKYPTVYSSHAQMYMRQFLHIHFGDKLPHAAGFNVGSFDNQFFKCRYQEEKPMFHHRSIEVGSLFMNWQKGPGTSYETRKILGLDGDVAHDAYLDNIDTILAVRKAYNDSKNLCKCTD